MAREHVILLSPEPPDETSRFPDFHNGMYIGGQIRLDAAARYMREHPEAEITLVGGYNRAGEGDVRQSRKVAAMAAFLVEHVVGIAPRMHLVPSLPCSNHNIVAALNDAAVRGDETTRIGVLTNTYHMPRTLWFADQAARTVRPGVTVDFYPLEAEAIVGRSIDEIIVGHEAEYSARLASEERGRELAETGAYADSCLTTRLGGLMPVIREHASVLLTPTERQKLGL